MSSISVKWGAVLIALNTLFGTAAYADAASAGQTAVFTDLKQADPSKISAILDAAEKGYLSGDPNGQFRPEATITRQELAVILTKVLSLKSDSKAFSLYKDVSDSSWSTYAIEAVKQAGIMTGDGNGRFNPSRPVTTEELATIIVRAINGSGARSMLANPAENGTVISAWAKTSVDVAAQLKLSELFENISNPKAAVQRQDIASLLLYTFSQTEQSAVITRINRDFVTIGDTSYLIEGPLKELIGDTNREALEGAVLKFSSLNRHVSGLQELEIVKKGAQLYTASLPSNTLLSISADDVTINGDVTGELKLNEGASKIQLQGNINQFTINSSLSIAINGNGSLQNLKVNSGSKITIDPSLSIQTLHLPDNVLPAQIIQNYIAIQSNIKHVQTASGAIVITAPITSVSTGNQHAANHAPTVANLIPALSRSVADGSQTVALSSVFADLDGDALTLSAVSSDTGVATVSVTGTTLSIIPVTAGTTTITVTANDGNGGTIDATFIAVFTAPVPVNHAPTVANSLSNLNKSVNDGSQMVGLGSIFADLDGDALTLSAVSSDTGVATVSVTGTTLSIMPVTAGTTTITVTANDGNGGTVDTGFTVVFTAPAPVNHAPTVANTISDLNKSVDDGSQTKDLSSVFADQDGDSLTLSAVSSDTGVATVSISGNTLTVVPVNAGTTTITVTANDGNGGTVDATFTAVFTPPVPVNHAPTVANTISDLNKSVDDGVQTTDLSSVFADLDGDTLSFSAVSSNTGVATVSASGNTLSIMPVNAGTTTITVTANDGNGGTVDASFTAVFSPPVPVNHAPTVANSISNLNKSVDDGSQTKDLSSVFADLDGDALTLSAVSSDTGVATVSVSGATLSIVPVTAGTTTITVTANDGNGGTVDASFTAVFTAPVPVNHAPTVANTISDLNKSVDDGSQTKDLSSVFADQDGDSLTLSAVSSDIGVATVSISGNTLTVVPVNAGTTTITVTADDGNGGTIEATFTAVFTPPVPVNHAPTVANSISNLNKSVDDGVQTTDLSSVFADLDGDTLSFSAVSSNTGVATVSASGNTLSIMPVNAGTTTITVTANDGNGGTVDATFTAVFTPPVPVNHAPTVANSISNLNKSVDDGVQTADLSSVFADLDGDTLSFSAVSSNPGVSTVSVSGSTLTIVPVSAGTTTITVTADDGNGGTVDASFTAVFTAPVPVNNAPTVANNISDLNKSIDDGTQTTDLSSVFSDEDGDALTLSAVSSNPGVATVSVSGSTLTIVPVSAGTTTITVSANDGNGGTVDATFTVTFTDAVPNATGIFISETVFGSDYLQAIELYNPTGESIDLSKLRIERSDSTDVIEIDDPTVELNSKQAIVITGPLGDSYDYFSQSFLITDDTNPVTLYLYYDNVLVDIAVISPYQSLARKSGRIIGSTTYEDSDWIDRGTDYTADLRTYEVD
ncbi:S-layer homology domain-containing protein [Paenibacillus sp. FSL R7-0345]|uniref:Ig-like domain-containing protein n=1 Tax=Paenibacillus sp. FSL R7-0345 TaxID=2954535 RepID=UPI0031599F8C